MTRIVNQTGRFTHPRLVLSVLEQAKREMPVGDLTNALHNTAVEAQAAGLVRAVSRARGRSRFTILTLTDAGRERLKLAHEAAWRIAAGLPAEER